MVAESLVNLQQWIAFQQLVMAHQTTAEYLVNLQLWAAVAVPGAGLGYHSALGCYTPDLSPLCPCHSPHCRLWPAWSQTEEWHLQKTHEAQLASSPIIWSKREYPSVRVGKSSITNYDVIRGINWNKSSPPSPTTSIIIELHVLSFWNYCSTHL